MNGAAGVIDEGTRGADPRLVFEPSAQSLVGMGAAHEQALVSLKLKKSVDAEGGRTFAVIIGVG